MRHNFDKCKECGEDIEAPGWNYCPNCGAYLYEDPDEEHMTINALIVEYQKKIDEIRFDMPAHEKMGSGQYYRHKLGMYEEFVRKLRTVEGEEE